MLSRLKMLKLEQEYANFDDFAQRSSHDERRQLFRSFHPDRIPTEQMEPELQHAITQIKPNERDDKAFCNQLKKRGLSDRDLERQLAFDPSRKSDKDVSKLAAFTYHSHPDIFRDISRTTGNCEVSE